MRTLCVAGIFIRLKSCTERWCESWLADFTFCVNAFWDLHDFYFRLSLSFALGGQIAVFVKLYEQV